ncbi:hypothetical protein C6376_33200 [Streptomyces sp. P3]|nr:hypothetical protein C6376_33200 [Streptomyces sp. P3]
MRVEVEEAALVGADPADVDAVEAGVGESREGGEMLLGVVAAHRVVADHLLADQRIQPREMARRGHDPARLAGSSRFDHRRRTVPTASARSAL